MKGLSARNLQYMTAMVRAWGTNENVPQVVAHLPWCHIRRILDKAATGEERDWYAAAAIRYRWSRNVLLNMMMKHSCAGTRKAGGAASLTGRRADRSSSRHRRRRWCGPGARVKSCHRLWHTFAACPIRRILDKAATGEERDWYTAAAIRYRWSRNVLLNMMMNRSMERTGAAPSNFTRQLAAPDSELAQQMAKDPCNFEFLGLSGEVAERDLENALTGRITETLQELGPGFLLRRQTSPLRRRRRRLLRRSALLPH